MEKVEVFRFEVFDINTGNYIHSRTKFATTEGIARLRSGGLDARRIDGLPGRLIDLSLIDSEGMVLIANLASGGDEK